MSWLRRERGAPEPPDGARDDAEPDPPEQAMPGLQELFRSARDDGTHSVLDLGPALPSNLRVYSAYARRMRFADLFTEAMSGQGWARALRALPPQPDRPYDLVFAWDLLDRLPTEARGSLVERLTEITAPSARLHLLVHSSPGSSSSALRFALVDTGRVRYEPHGPPGPVPRPLLPAETERLLRPFRVIRGFTLKAGFREYLAARGSG